MLRYAEFFRNYTRTPLQLLRMRISSAPLTALSMFIATIFSVINLSHLKKYCHKYKYFNAGSKLWKRRSAVTGCRQKGNTSSVCRYVQHGRCRYWQRVMAAEGVLWCGERCPYALEVRGKAQVLGK